MARLVFQSDRPDASSTVVARRLRLATFALVALVVTLAGGLELSGRALFPYLFGDDLIPSYMAGTFVREGQADLLTDYAAAQRFQAHLRRVEGLEMHGRTGPWLNPPFYALLFVPLSALPYRAALWTWFGLNLLMLGTSIGLLHRMLPAASRKKRDLLVIGGLVLFSMPGLQVISSQQNTFLSLLLLCLAVSLWRADRTLLAGAIAGLLAFKPQLALILWAAMILTLGRRALLGIAASVSVLAIATFWFLPGAMVDYVIRLPALLPYLRTDRPYPWERQVTFTGFWRLLIQGRVGGSAQAGITPIVASGILVLGLMLLWAIWRARRLQPRSPEGTALNLHMTMARAPRYDRVIAATIVSMPLLMPYYMDYDLLLLAVPATLYAAERMGAENRKPARDQPVLIAGWIVLFGWLYFNAAFAEATGVSLTVVLLAAGAATTIWRVARRGQTLTAVAIPRPLLKAA